MMRTLHRLALLLPALVTAGCATGYWPDRGHDALDVLTVTVGKGAGAKLRAGPVHAGLAVVFDKAGLRGGMLGEQGDCRDVELPLRVAYPAAASGEAVLFGAELYEPPDEHRGKSFRALSPLPFFYTQFQDAHDQPCRPPAAYYTQIELAAGLAFSLRLGVNLGELADFALGWTTVDLCHDDARSRALAKGPGPASAAPGASAPARPPEAKRAK